MTPLRSTHYGNLNEFNSANKDWSSYIERLDLFFEANKIGVEKRKPVLLNTGGAEACEIFKGLASPVKLRR